MPRKGPAFPISPEWQREVRTRINERGISQNELARLAGVSIAAMSEALREGAVQTTVMVEINKAIGLPRPTPFTPDSLEMLSLFDDLSEIDRGAAIEYARSLKRKTRKRS